MFYFWSESDIQHHLEVWFGTTILLWLDIDKSTPQFAMWPYKWANFQILISSAKWLKALTDSLLKWSNQLRIMWKWLRFQLCYLALWPSASYLTTLNFGFYLRVIVEFRIYEVVYRFTKCLAYCRLNMWYSSQGLYKTLEIHWPRSTEYTRKIHWEFSMSAFSKVHRDSRLI